MTDIQYATYKANIKIHVGLRRPWKVREEFKFLAVNTLNLRHSGFYNAPEFTNTLTDLNFFPCLPKKLITGVVAGIGASTLPGISTNPNYYTPLLLLAATSASAGMLSIPFPSKYRVRIKHFDSVSEGRGAVSRMINLIGDDFRIIGGYDTAIQGIEELVHETLPDPIQNYKRALVNHLTA